ncbi:hypothetical protein [Chishuiella sp.]|uniref:hypothetical protein n=1 Tax=Chishuiella sp. TaxID=1969467 RepID=UPI0028A85EDF|nr:hypothetical protein [Chishuiella sp.]
MYEKYYVLLFLLLLLFIIGIIIIPSVIVYRMAIQRGRNSIVWVIFSLFFLNAVLCMIALYFLGETDEKRKERIIEEENWKNSVRNPKDPDIEMKKWLERNPSKNIKDYYLSGDYKNI